MLLNILKLIRAKNLLIIAVTQYLMRYAVIFPMLKAKGYESQFNNLNFFLLVISTMLLAAAGYIINDYFDTKTDLLNRPKTVIVGKHIRRRSVMTAHIIINLLGIIIGFYISWQINLWKLVYIFILVTGLLWFYSASYQNMFLIGNIIVAILTALVPLMTVLYEIPPLNEKYFNVLIRLDDNFYKMFFWVAGFSIFAFITTLNREIIKDIEDFEGDNAYGSRSLPVMLGINNSKIVTVILSLITAVLIIFTYFKFIHIPQAINYVSIVYIFIFLIIPTFILTYKIIKAQNSNDWRIAGNISKLIMLFGIMYSLLVWYSYNY